MTQPRRTPTRSILSRPTEATDLRESAERRRAIRSLLLRPLLHGTGPQADEQTIEDLRLVRRHKEAITAELVDGLRYRLIVDPAGARLVKAGLGRDGSRPLRRPSKGSVPGRPFTPRGYALLMVALAVVSRSGSQLLLGELVGEIRSAAAGVDLDVDLDAIADRRLVHAVLLVLTEYGVLVERDGSLDGWAENGTSQSLLDVSAERLALLLAVPLAAGRTVSEVLDAPPLSSAAGGARIAIRRALTESPVLTTSELDPGHQDWWVKSRNKQVDWFERVLGLELELRAEGALAVDSDEELTDEAFPGTGTERRAALLVLARLVELVRPQALGADLAVRSWSPVEAATMRGCVDEVLGKYGATLKKQYLGEPAALEVEVTAVLARVGLLRRSGETDWELHAAAARYAVTTTVRTAAVQDDLFSVDSQ